jgi:hypothetical protein
VITDGLTRHRGVHPAAGNSLCANGPRQRALVAHQHDADKCLFFCLEYGSWRTDRTGGRCLAASIRLSRSSYSPKLLISRQKDLTPTPLFPLRSAIRLHPVLLNSLPLSYCSGLATGRAGDSWVPNHTHRSGGRARRSPDGRLACLPCPAMSADIDHQRLSAITPQTQHP